ncbi:MAG: cell division ATP-binding protein FtsE [Paracoccaceae bacterium]
MIGFRQATFSYQAREILSGVDLDIEPGGFLFLTGPSGAGKTTLLRLCYLSLRPTSGRVLAFGEDVSSADRDTVARLRQRIGVVHQDGKFLDHLSVAENIALPLRVSGRYNKGSEADMRDLLDWVGMKDRADALPVQLSGGEKQRAALARAVINSPDLLIADEPTGNVDWEMAVRLLDLMIELNRLGKAVLVATHDLSLIRAAKSRVAARVVRLHKGAVRKAEVDL